MDKLAANALESAAYGDQASFSFADPKPAIPVRTFDQAIAELPIARLVEIGREILDLILPVDPHRPLQHLAGAQPGLGQHPQPERT